MSEDSGRRRNAKIASQSQIHAAAHAVAMDAGDHRNGKTVDGVHQPLAGPRKLERLRAVELGNLFEIGAGGKELVVAGNDQGLDVVAFGIVLQFTNIFEQSSNRSAAEFVGVVSRYQLQYGATALIAPAKNRLHWFISVHPRSS